MIPTCYPSQPDSQTGREAMIVYYLADVTGLVRWTDYIPVRTVQNEISVEQSTDTNGFQSINTIADITGLTPFLEYVPVYEDGAATVPFSTDATGYIPVGRSGAGSATLFYDFAKSLSLSSAITFTNASANRSYFDANGTLKYAGVNEPRFDHDPLTGESLGLLPEEARTNQFIYSSQFDNAAWVKGRATITSNAITAPDGTLTADRIVETAVVGTHYVSQAGATIVSGNTYTFNWFVKKGERTFAAYSPDAALFGTTRVTANLTTGETLVNSGSATVAMESLLDDWWLLSVTATATSGGTLSANFLQIATSLAGSVSYLGDITKGLYVWGAQLDSPVAPITVAAEPSSYFPTVATALTRSADTNSQTVTSLINALENTVVTSFVGNVSGTRTVLEIGDGTANERIYLQSVAGTLTLKVVDGGVEQCSLSLGSVVTGTKYKVAFAWKLNDFAAAINGAACVTDTSGTIPTVTTLYEGHDYLVANHLNKTIERTAIFPSRLVNSNLQALSR